MTKTATKKQPEQGFRVPIVCRIAGISYRQLDYWARTNLVRPSVRESAGPGPSRLYSFEDVVRLRVIRALLDVGTSLQQIRRVLAVAADDPILVVTGQRAYAFDSPDELAPLLVGDRALIAVNVRQIRDDLADTLRKFGAKS